MSYKYFLLIAMVLYVDYGNEEIVQYSSLRRLDPKFCQLPYQAIMCDLFNISPADPSSTWTDQVNEWFTNLLFDTSLRVSIVSCSSPNTVSLEAFLPARHLMNSVVANFDLNSENFDRDFISLTSFMHHIGLSKPTDSNTDHLCALGVITACSPGAWSIKQNLEQTFFPSVADLPPLVLNLNESNEFTCLLSLVSNDMLLYVHPVQVDVAHNITALNETLQVHYSVEENRIAVASGHLKSGRLCVVYSIEFQEWCRAVIVAIHGDLSSGNKLTCLIFYLDFGGSVWVESSQLCILIPVLCAYPAMVICCGLTGSKGESIDMVSPRKNSEVTRSRFFCSTEQEILASKCVCSVTAAIENISLVAVVMVEMGKCIILKKMLLVQIQFCMKCVIIRR